MINNFLFASVLALFLVQGNGLDINESLSKLGQMTNAAAKNVSVIVENINNARDRYNEMVKDKIPCLCVQYRIHTLALKNITVQTTFKALSKDKQLLTYPCIAAASNEYLNALHATYSKMSEESDRIKDKGVASLKAFNELMPGFYMYLSDLHSEYEGMLKGCQTEDNVKKVFGEAVKKIEKFNALLEQLDKKFEEMRFDFFNEYAGFVYVVDKSFRKSSNDGKAKVTACLKK